jgi:hypothetical protein
MKKKTMCEIIQLYMYLIEDGLRIHGICKKNEIDKTMRERNPDTQWYFALWPVKKYVVDWYKGSSFCRCNYRLFMG